ncbi:MAG: glutaminyl-peptide cyclotransferase [Solitalea-like symbiont of Tyrophagus putrescentiae]
MIKALSKYNKILIFLISLIFLTACSHKGKLKWLVIDSQQNNIYPFNSDITINLEAEKNITPNQITVTLDKIVIAKSENSKKVDIPAKAFSSVGKKDLEITISVNDHQYNIEHSITLLSNKYPKRFGYKLINIYPHDTSAFTQGLEYNYLGNNNSVFESTGLYGESKLKEIDIKTGKVLKEIFLEPQYFGEGLTVLNDKLLLLTWRENTGFIYNPSTFEQTDMFSYQQSKEGWGLTNDGNRIYKSDGTENIWLLDPISLKELSHFQVYDNKGPVTNLNELEYVDNYIYANVFQTNNIVIINPSNGIVEGIIDLSGLLQPSDIKPETDVLNGIAYNKKTKKILVTGKRWPKLFEITLNEIK